MICTSLLSRDHKIDGLQSLEAALQRHSAAHGGNFLCSDENVMFIDKVFKGIRSCLNVDENDEEVLMKTNQILYDLMPDILKYPVELQPEISTLIPALVENLGNPKVSSDTLNLVRQMCESKLTKLLVPTSSFPKNWSQSFYI